MQPIKWSDQEKKDFQSHSHRAFRPGDTPKQKP